MLKALLAVVLIAGLAEPALAQMQSSMGTQKGMQHRHMQMSGMSMEGQGEMGGSCLDYADKIGLTDEQLDKLTPIHREMEKKGIQYRADLRIAQIELQEIMEVKDFDLEKADLQVKKIEALRASHHLEMLKLMKEAHSVLTDDQFKKMKRLMRKNIGKTPPARKMPKKK